MCGIVGYIGPRDATPIILNGLKRLEYRGYDSAGLAILSGDCLEVRKDAGKLSQLIELVHKSPINGAPGIGHTRWATHGAPNARNAHPHFGKTKRVVVVQNGIVVLIWPWDKLPTDAQLDAALACLHALAAHARA